MSANFYDLSAVMAGVDLHTYLAAGGPVPVPTPLTPHAVAVPFTWTATIYKATASVRADGERMIQLGYDIYLVPHFPLTALPPHPVLEAVALAKTILASGSEARMAVHSVTGCGEPLATCLAGFFGVNVNCWDPMPSGPTGPVICVSSVKTSPSAGDYVGALVGYYVDAGFDFVFGLGGPLAAHIWRRFPDLMKALFDIDGDPADSLQRKVQQAVDGVMKAMGLD
jgi:hypothetical protein